MLDVAEEFGPFDGRVWLNCAHQGPLPRTAAEAAREAIEWKRSPSRLTGERFAEVPARVRRALGRLLGVAAEEIILANSASYGLHLLANGIPFEEGDEILLMDGDFPSDILPWLALRERGVRVRLERPADVVFQPAEVEELLTPRTRALCVTWVHSFSGRAIDLEGIGRACRANGTRFLINASQALGARPLDLSTAPVDAVTSVGWKWLLGPYATGFCWLRPDLLESLRYNQAYWLTLMTADDLGGGIGELAPPSSAGARRYDLFATANFFNYHAWAVALELLLDWGIEAVARHDQSLVDSLVRRLPESRFELRSARDGEARSTLVVLSHRDPSRNRPLYEELVRRGIDVALRLGNLRISPHVHNRPEDVDRCLDTLSTGD